MKIFRTAFSIMVQVEENFYEMAEGISWDTFVNRDDLFHAVMADVRHLTPVVEGAGNTVVPKLLAPVGSQEVWAAGVTYLRSKVARMEESEESGGATFYDKVYEAERPELFFKSTAAKVVPPYGKVRIRKDSSWDVPEPELTLFITSSGKIVAYTIGNDMSSRSIEGENPLYLPQAKTYDGSAAIGPCIYVPEAPIPADTQIMMSVARAETIVFQGTTAISQMKRKHTELAEFLFRENSFPAGCFLMTGTCIVPGNDFTLQSGDVVSITIDHIGTLINTVE